MSSDVMSREAILLKIKAAEKAGQQRQAAAKEKAIIIHTNTQKEYSQILDNAEMEARQTMRVAVETAKKENSSIRDRKIQIAKKSGKELENKSVNKVSGVVDLMFNLFNKEFNVKD